jgi:hypothetical protein
MRDELAEALLRRVMGWGDDDVTRERPILKALADYKYDAYERYEPGMRFIESLACWLAQFPEQAQRHKAFEFVRQELIFVSSSELQHLVGSVYPDFIRPALLSRTAEDLGIRPHLVARVKGEDAFRVRRRSCLFVGLSDGAHTDILRRANPIISNEQVVADYHGLGDRAPELLKDLRADLATVGIADPDEARFTTLVLLDDFSASGISYLRKEDDKPKGKIAKIAQQLTASPDLLDSDTLDVRILLYVATDQAMTYLGEQLGELAKSISGTWSISRIQGLTDVQKIRKGDDTELDALIDLAYVDEINDKHMKKGGTDGRYGFADCALPVVLSHNTPNNSIAILWANEGGAKALFPRVTRHKEAS